MATLDDITICITAFMRPDSLARCLASLDRHYPDVPRLVVDTGGNAAAGRNAAIRQATTPFVVLCDDDMEFGLRTDLAAMREVLRHDPEIGGTCGVVYERKPKRPLRWYANLRRFRGRLLYEPAHDWRVTDSGIWYAACDMVLNGGLWRREVLLACPFDEELQIQEHKEFLWRLKQLETWRCAFVPQVTISHWADRPTKEYAVLRYRSEFNDLARQKIGAEFPAFRGVALASRLNIVVLGLPHANTTITVRQLEALGWNVGEADPHYREPLAVRALNKAAERGEPFNLATARDIVAAMKQPWVIKDPRFSRGLLGRWLPAVARYRPLLLWCTKDLGAIRESLRRRKEDRYIADLEKWAGYCQRQYDVWPWGKLRLDAAQINAACGLWKLATEPS